MRAYLITLYCLGSRRQYTALAPSSCDAIVAALSAFPQADKVSVRPVTVH